MRRADLGLELDWESLLAAAPSPFDALEIYSSCVVGDVRESKMGSGTTVYHS